MLQRFKQEVRANLQENILPYWIDRMVDPRGGFYGRRDGDDALDVTAPKGAILNARILWTFSAAYRALGCREYLDMATRAKREIIDRFYDREFGGVYWSLNPDGSVLESKKQFYALGFAIYGLSEYARATADVEARDYAMRLFHDIELHSRDRRFGGYIEACRRDWSRIADMRLSDKDENTSKTMNTHLHIIEPYTNLLRLTGDAQVREATRGLLRLFFDTFEGAGKRGHLALFFDDSWCRRDDEISYGHDIEASWLLLDTALALGEPALIDEARRHTRRIAEAALEGRCCDGSMVYERHADGSYDNDKHWWVQAENVIGQYYLYLHHSMPDMLGMAYQSWQYIRDNLVDPAGEWYWSRRGSDINRTDDKAGFWKCPYHNSRMCLEILK